MIRLYLTISFIAISSLFSYSQNPLAKQWDREFGGNDYDYLTAFQQTSDGGYILGGFSFSGIGGEKTQDTRGGYDYWIVKVDSLGNKQWDRDFGGTAFDKLYSMQQTRDGGYILGGYSESGISGDKSGNSKGLYDYWVIKLDSAGNKLWDKDFGGTSWEQLTSLKQTKDGGYILGGTSVSGISGDKTQDIWNSYDYWIIKIDSLGNKQWDKDFGGTDYDFLNALEQTRDGGYLLGGYSMSGIGGDKTQASNDTARVFNIRGDYWIVKIDSIGNKQWDKDFGGFDVDILISLIQTNDGGYILAGTSNSEMNGDKSQPLKGSIPYTACDYWIIKIDSVGNKQWDKDFGGPKRQDEIGSIALTKDGGYLIGGTSYSPTGGDKSEDNMGNEQTWVVKTDALGNKLWDKTLHTNTGITDDEIGFAIQSRDGCYVFANYTPSAAGGDKTQSSHSLLDDYWIIKFCDTSKISLAFLAMDTAICANGCINFVNLSTYAASYEWHFEGAIDSISTDQNPQNICYSNAGIFNVRLIASNGMNSDTITFSNYIKVFSQPPTPSIVQLHDTLVSSTDSSYTSYQWYDNSTIIPGATNNTYYGAHSGNYNLAVTDSNGCIISVGINVVISGFGQFTVTNGLTVTPNPATSSITISSPVILNDLSISIYDLLGERVVLSAIESPVNMSETINVQSLSAGVYFLQIVSGGDKWNGKFIKQ